MATLQLAPPSAFDSAHALRRIARALLSLRMMFFLIVVGWTVSHDAPRWLLVPMLVACGWWLLMLLRWESFGLVLCSHPAILAIDGAFGFVLLSSGGIYSPILLILGTGIVLVGLCLGLRGIAWLLPLYLVGWTLVALDAGQIPEFDSLVLVPAILGSLALCGERIRTVTLDAHRAERALRTQTRRAGVAEERARLSREMHDSLAKSLQGIAMMADVLPLKAQKSPEGLAESARTVARLLHRTVAESREMIVSMRRVDANKGTADLVRESVRRWKATSGREVQLEIMGEPEVSPESAYELHAILGEALENIHRHTGPESEAIVRLSSVEGWLELSVTDTGVGREACKGKPGGGNDQGVLDKDGHYGLLGMRERAARIGGMADISARVGEAVVVRVRAPIRSPE